MRQLVKLSLIAFIIARCITGAKAESFSFEGYLDARIVFPSSEKSWIDGGLGKFRFGDGQPSPNIRAAEAVGQGALDLSNTVVAVTSVRLEPEQRTGADVLEAYLAWRPRSINGWRLTAKAGAFFPSISLENEDIGWSSPYTITSSAINSWIGEELRTVGTEVAIEYDTGWGKVFTLASVFCCNEPAGTFLADRGWSLIDRPTGLFERVRDPDITLLLSGEVAPARYSKFQNIDGRVGGYGGIGISVPTWGQVELLRYDNNADPFSKSSRDESWHTRFWSASYKDRIGGVEIISQAMSGDTSVGDDDLYITRFKSVFMLASYDIGAFRISGRAEAFQTRNFPSNPQTDEDGGAFTAALFWNAKDWIRLGGELIVLDSRRLERASEGISPHSIEKQVQIDARVSF